MEFNLVLEIKPWEFLSKKASEQTGPPRAPEIKHANRPYGESKKPDGAGVAQTFGNRVATPASVHIEHSHKQLHFGVIIVPF